MIIRSQDKERISVINNNDSIGSRNRTIYAYNGNNDTRVELGEYSTEKKVIKVLDMICEHYQNCEMCKCGLRQVAETEFVFQMPQDSEV